MAWEGSRRGPATQSRAGMLELSRHSGQAARADPRWGPSWWGHSQGQGLSLLITNSKDRWRPAAAWLPLEGPADPCAPTARPHPRSLGCFALNPGCLSLSRSLPRHKCPEPGVTSHLPAAPGLHTQQGPHKWMRAPGGGSVGQGWGVSPAVGRESGCHGNVNAAACGEGSQVLQARAPLPHPARLQV